MKRKSEEQYRCTFVVDTIPLNQNDKVNVIKATALIRNAFNNKVTRDPLKKLNQNDKVNVKATAFILISLRKNLPKKVLVKSKLLNLNQIGQILNTLIKEKHFQGRICSSRTQFDST